jgi:hypothetical protein
MGQQLVIRHVADCTIDDQARIGWVDIGEIVFDTHASSVIIRSNFPPSPFGLRNSTSS